MIEARFTSEMREMLKSLKGFELVGYSATELYAGKTVHDGNVYLHVGGGTIRISNKEKQIPWFRNKDLSDIEEIFSFSCVETFEQGEQTIAIKERIEEVELITDYIKIPQKNYEIALDMALIIVTEAHRYVISRGWHFGEYLDINVDKDYDDMYSAKQAVEEWNNFGEWEVEVNRVIQQL